MSITVPFFIKNIYLALQEILEDLYTVPTLIVGISAILVSLVHHFGTLGDGERGLVMFSNNFNE